MRKVLVKENTYFDSATLMAIAQKVKNSPGVSEAVAVMGTSHNKELLAGVGFLDEAATAARSRDLVIAVKGEDVETVESAISAIQEQLSSSAQDEEAKEEKAPTSLEEAIQKHKDANLVLISVPGQFAAREARKALEAGFHVMIFSDNVPVEDELALKQLAAEKGLLLMGPDCGTAIINGAPLAFANVIRKANIGIVAAAGTGLQEVSTLIHRYGGGISQAIGTGGRDVKEKIGGLQMIQGLEALIDDPETEVIVLISKPPAKSVEEKILSLVKKSPKPVVAGLLGGERSLVEEAGGVFAASLEEAARKSVSLIGLEEAQPEFDYAAEAKEAVKGMSSEQRWLRGLFTGGTLCYEAILNLRDLSGGIHTNIPLTREMALEDSYRSFQHTVVDLGEDEFTKGRPHPMIEPSLRGERILQEAKDPEVAVLLLDFVLGYGAHAEPVDAVKKELEEAMRMAKERGGRLVVVASVTGTDLDPQNFDTQVQKLKDIGAYVLPSNFQAVQFAAAVIQELERMKSHE